MPLVKKGGVIIVTHPLYDEFDPEHHAPYIEFFNRLLPETRDAMVLGHKYEEEFARNPSYVHLYRKGNSAPRRSPLLHVVLGRERAAVVRGKIICAGAENNHVPALLGWDRTDTLSEAIEEARGFMGKSASISSCAFPRSCRPRFGSRRMYAGLVVMVALGAAQAHRLAAPGLSGLDVPADAMVFYNEHLSLSLARRGVDVMTAKQIETLVGIERQRQLLGCSDQSCMAELADALGADTVLTGQIGRFGESYQLNFKIISGRDAQRFSTYSKRVARKDDLLEALDEAAGRARRRARGGGSCGGVGRAARGGSDRHGRAGRGGHRGRRRDAGAGERQVEPAARPGGELERLRRARAREQRLDRADRGGRRARRRRRRARRDRRARRRAVEQRAIDRQRLGELERRDADAERGAAVRALLAALCVQSAAPAMTSRRR